MDAELNPAQRLHGLGQSLWLDSINRVMLRTGALARYVHDLVNVTLLFSDTHYLRTADAYLRALERRRRAGLDLAVPSVASVFISRWDSAADPLLPSALHGSLGLAMAQKTYASHPRLLSDQRWQALAEAGARPQRVLWASTSTKNPDLPDTYYLGRLAAPNTIDTVPEQTLLAFADRGGLDDRLEPDYAAVERAIAAAPDAGIDADALAEHLQRHVAVREAQSHALRRETLQIADSARNLELEPLIKNPPRTSDMRR